MTAVIANLDFVKERNISATFRAIVELGPISRIQIARYCLLAAGSVTRITRQLIDAGLIKEVELQCSDRGRPAISLMAEVERLQILAVKAGRSSIHLGLCDLSGNLVAEHNEPMTADNQDDFSDQLITAILTFLKVQADDIRLLTGIGITSPGLVNSSSGIINYLPHLPVDNLPLAEEVTTATGIPCYINNFTSAMALAEFQMGVTRGCQNSVMVSIHNGVGSGMILDGKLYEGSSIAAGEIGHIQIDPLGKRCYCGNFGCLEMLVSNKAIEQRCHKRLEEGVPSQLNDQSNINDICQAANEGDFLAVELLKKAAADLGRVIAMSVNLLSPERIVLAGEICQASDIIHPVIHHCLRSQTVSFVDSPEVEVVNSTLYDYPWFGSFALVRRALLEQGLLWEIIKQFPVTEEH